MWLFQIVIQLFLIYSLQSLSAREHLLEDPEFLAKGRIEDTERFPPLPLSQPRDLSAHPLSRSPTKAPNLSGFCVQLPNAQLKAAGSVRCQGNKESG